MNRTKNLLVSAALKAALFGILAVAISLPILWIIHGAFGLGNPPLTGILVLGGTVVLSFALAGVLGAYIGSNRGNPLVAALLGLALGITACAVAAPLYGSMVAEGLARDAAGLTLGLNPDQSLEGAAKDFALGQAGEAFQAAREGRLRERISDLQKQARDATTPAAREGAENKALELKNQLVNQGKTKGVELLKSGAARSSAFALLMWALVGSPLVAALAARGAKR